MLMAEDLGYSGDALKMDVPVWHNGTYPTTGTASINLVLSAFSYTSGHQFPSASSY